MPTVRFAQSRRRLVAVAATLVTAAGVITGVALTGPAGASPAAVAGFVDFGCANPANLHSKRLLPAARVSIANGVRCFGKLRPSASSSQPDGLNPGQIRGAYGLRGLKAHGRTVAIVDAMDDPNVASDLAVYRKKFNLPPCTTANGCFRKVNQNGKASPLPAGDPGWGEEITLDVDAVSATCPDCKILLVEASSADTQQLLTGVATAVRMGAFAVSNSYGGDEDNTIRALDVRYLKHPGVAITASAGDDGYGVSWPASSPYVTAVGGTTLTSTGKSWTETVWNGTGSGCSAYEPKPAWQHDTGCAKRTVADVAADADPNTGLAVYGTYNDCTVAALCNSPVAGVGGEGLDGWAQVGGTSLSSPIVASIYTLAGRKVNAGSYPYAHTKYLYDVRSGSNDTGGGLLGGSSCNGSYLCTARAGYDGPTGLGTPRGTGGF